MLDSYRTVLARPGAALFSATGLVARLPISMVGLGIVLLVEGETGSYGLAGAVSAVALVGNAVLAVPQGRWTDRLGQARVLPLAATLWGLGLGLLVVSVVHGWPVATTYVFAALAGLALPGIGNCVRARWVHVLQDPRQRQTGFAIEAVADETVFMLGPILVTVLATQVSPAAGLVAALVAGTTFVYLLALQRGTEPPAHPRPRGSGASAPMPWVPLLALTLVSVALGSMFGSAEVVTVAFSEEQGSQGYAGPLLALWALGSLLAGVVTGAVAWRHGPEVRLPVGAAALVVAMAPLVVVPSVATMAPVLLVGGFAIAPTLIAAMSMAQEVVPAARLTEGMAFVHTGIVAGVAPGAALAGLVIDAHGASPAYLVSLGGATVALLAALVARAASRRTRPLPADEERTPLASAP